MNGNTKEMYFRELEIKYWGEYNRYSKLCENNPIMQNILQACYDIPRSINDISCEIGVAVQYVNNAVLRLCEYGLLRQTTKGYQTNIIILLKNSIYTTDELIDMQTKLFSTIYEFGENNYKEFLEIISDAQKDSENRLKWQFYSLILYIGLLEKFQLKAELVAPVTVMGDRGFIWAEEHGLSDPYGNVNICNIVNDIGDIIHFVEYSNFGEKINNCFNNNHYDEILFQIANSGEVSCEHFTKRDMQDIVKMSNLKLLKYDRGKVSTTISVYNKYKYQSIQNFLREVTSDVAKQTVAIIAKISDMLLDQSPSTLRNQIKNIAALQMLNYIYAPMINYIMESNFNLSKQATNILISFIVLST